MKLDGLYSNEKEMKDWFKERTSRHIGLVQKYCKRLSDEYPGLIKRGETHDKSKWEEPEYTPYLLITWQYKMKDNGKSFDPPADIKEKMSRATEHHVKNNSHHPEYHSKKEVGVINREDRDKPPEEMIDATAMPDLDIAEMVCDWCAMGEEKGNTAKYWADKNVNIRWKFTDEQKSLIYRLIEKACDGHVN